MREFATLTIHRKISRRADPIYGAIYEGEKRGESREQVLRREKREDIDGNIRFIEHVTGVYAEHIPLNESDLDAAQLRMESEIALEWLLCFSYQEMEVIGLDLGVFQAEASVEEVLERLQWCDIPSTHDMLQKRNALVRWIREKAHPEDRIMLCSNWIFYDEEGKYDYYFVRNFINKKIASMREEITCPHWSKTKVERPKQMQMKSHNSEMIAQMTA